MSSTSTRYFLYARKSTDRDDHQVKSIEDQVAVLKAVAKRDGILIVDTFEEAESAKLPHIRPLFAEMVRRIEKGEARGILAWHVNRLFRNPYDSGLIQQHLQDEKIECIRTPERAYYPEDNALLLAVESGMANQYVRDLRRDVSRGVTEKARRGWWPYRPPLGYRVNSLTKDIEANGDEFVLLRRAWDLLLTKAYTVPQIGAKLTEWGFRLPKTKTKQIRTLSRTSLYRVFSNPFYKGELSFQGTQSPGNHQAMVTREEFAMAQTILRGRNYAKPQKHVFPFTGYIRCGVCGCLITADYKTKTYLTTGTTRSYTYYHCTGRKGCAKDSVSETYINDRIVELLTSCRVEPEMVDWFLESIGDPEDQAPATDSLISRKQYAEEARLEQRLATVFEMREAGEITGEEFQARKGLYQASLTTLRTGLASAEIERESRHTVVIRKLQVAKDALERFTEGTVDDKREVARAIAQSYVLTLGNLEITPDPLFDVLRTFEPSRSGPQQVGKDPTGPDSSAWRAFRSSIHSLINQSPESPSGSGAGK